MIKLAAIYNVFDGEENLQSSINSIRDCVDTVIVIQQQISNFGINHKNNLKEKLSNFKGIDYIIDFIPNLSLHPGKNEFLKRIEGIKKAIELNCTHYIHVDCDEEYGQREFKEAYEEIIKNDYDSSACYILNYFKFKNLLIEEDKYMCVPFIHKIQKGKMNLSTESKYPVLVDKTRKGNPTDNFFLFKNLNMHHYSWVRENIEDKINNSTARVLFEPYKKEIIKCFNEFKIGDELIRTNTRIPLPKTILKYFNIKDYNTVNTRIIK